MRKLKFLFLITPFICRSDDIKEYFGHRIGLYFLYLQHYVTMLVVPAVLGAVTFIGEPSPSPSCEPTS